MPINQDKYRNIHLTSGQISDYLTRQFDDAESHEIEQHLLNCPLCQDALDGYETMNAREIQMDLDVISSKIEGRVASGGMDWSKIAVAASVSVLLVSIFLLYRFMFPNLEQDDLALNNEDNFEVPSTIQDSINQNISDEIVSNEFKMPHEESVIEIKSKDQEVSKKEAVSEFKLEEEPFQKQVESQPVQEVNAVHDEDYAAVDELDESADMFADEPVELASSPEEEITEEVIAQELSNTRKDESQLKATGAVMRAAAPDSSLGIKTYSEDQVVSSQAKKMKVTEEIAQIIIDPEPESGMEQYMRTIQSNLNYPTPAKENQIAGSVVLTFQVSETGEVSNIKVTKGLAYGCDDEAVRLIQTVGDWVPGTINDVPTEMEVSLTVVFRLPE